MDITIRMTALIDRVRGYTRITTPLYLACIGLSVSLYSLHSNFLEKNFNLYNQQLARLVADNISYSLSTGNRKVSHQQLKSVLRYPNVIRVELQEGGRTTLSASRYVIDNSSEYTSFRHDFAPPLSPESVKTAPNRITLTVSRKAVSLSRYWSASIAFLLCLLGFAGSWLVGKRLGSTLNDEIDELESISEKLGKGDYNINTNQVMDNRFSGIHASLGALVESLKKEVTDTYSSISEHNRKFSDELQQFRDDAQVMANRLEDLQASGNIQRSVLLSLQNNINGLSQQVYELIGDILSGSSDPDASLRLIQSLLEEMNTAINESYQLKELLGDKDPEPVVVNFDLRDTIEQTLEKLSWPAYNRNNEFILMFYEDVERKLEGCAECINAIISNMVRVANHYTCDGTIIIRASVEDEDDFSSTFTISISDNGSGITLERQKQITSLLKTGITGWEKEDDTVELEFILAQKHAQAIGSQIAFSSMLGEGTSTSFTVKCNKQPHITAKRRHEAAYNEYKCLLYDGNDVSRCAMNPMLSDVNMEVSATKHSEDIANLVNNSFDTHDPYQVIIISLSNTEMHTGFIQDILDNIRNTEDYIIVLLANTHDQSVLDRLRLPGITHCFPKVTPQKTLLTRINSSFVLQGRIRNKSVQLHGSKVLVVDDDSVSRKFVSATLKESGATIDEATGGDEAVRMAAHGSYDVIFMDIYMPGTNGIEATRTIRNSKTPAKNTPIIALTSNTLYQNRSNCVKLGFDACLVKPIDNTTLLNTTLSHLNLNESRFHTIDFKKVREETRKKQAKPAGSRNYDLDKALKITGGNAELAEELYVSLLEELPGMKKRMNSAYIEQDYPELESTAHKIHGAAAYCAVTSIKELANQLEKATIRNNINDIKIYVTELNNDIDRLLTDRETA